MNRRKKILIITLIWASSLLFIPLCLSALILSCRHSDKQSTTTPNIKQQERSDAEHKNEKVLSPFRLRYFKADEPFWKMKAEDEETEVLKASQIHRNNETASITFLAKNSSLISWLN